MKLCDKSRKDAFQSKEVVFAKALRYEKHRHFRNSGESGMIGMAVISLNKEVGIQSPKALHAAGVVARGFIFILQSSEHFDMT